MSAADRIAALEDEVAQLTAYAPMLARMAFFEKFAGSVPDHLLALGDRIELGDPIRHDYGPEWRRPVDEGIPAAARALQDAYNARERARRGVAS